MTVFTVWVYEDPGTAAHAAAILTEAAAEGLVTVQDHAVVSWPLDVTKPTVEHGHDSRWGGTAWGAFWGLLLGAIFFLPVIGVAAGAALGAARSAMRSVGIDSEQIDRIRADVKPGTSALFTITEDADLDRLGERFHGIGGQLVSTNLTPAERSTLLETFGS